MTPQSRISINVHPVPDKGKLMTFVRALNPRAVVVLNATDTAREIKDALPDCEVIFRFKGGTGEGDDGANLLIHTPAMWLSKMAAKLGGDKRIILHTTNEAPLTKQVIDWHVELLKLANMQGWRLCVLNLATGNPEPEKRDDKGNIIQESQWQIAHSLLELLSQHRQHILGLHEYAGGIITSGLIGGNPKFIAPGEWPAIVPFTRWHMGRNRFLVAYCERHEIEPPRIILTEHGFDDTYDIKPWLDTLVKTPPFPNIRGWRSLVNQWKSWWPMWDAERAYFEQLKWANEALYKGTPVEAQCIFTFGNSGGWEGFDIYNAPELQGLLIDYAKVEPSVMYPPLPFGSDTRFKKWVNESGDNYRVRPYPNMQYAESGWITKDEAFDYIPDVSYENWIQVKSLAGIIGWTDRGILAKALPPPIPLPEPPPALVDLAALSAAIPGLNRTADEIAVEIEALQQKHDALAVELAALDEQISAWAHARARLIDSRKLIELYVEAVSKAA